jgi:hypothetical protein
MDYVLSSAVSVTRLTFADLDSAIAAYDRHVSAGYVGLCLSRGDEIIRLQ